MTLPLWSTPERRKHLVRLFDEHGNKCLQGHRVCPDRSHYLAYDVKMQWEAVESRKACVDEYGEKTGEFVQVWGKRPYYAYVPIKQRLIDKIAEAAIDSWKAEDTERRNYEWKLEQRQIHDGTYGRYGGSFDPVARDVYVNGRPAYYLVGLGVNPFTYKRVALVRIPSTSIHLFVDVGSAIQEVSKNARRKAMRHGRLRNGVLMEKIDELCKLAVADWWMVKR